MSLGDFPPPIRPGRSLHVVLIVLLTGLVAGLSFLISRQPISLVFTAFILLAVLAFIPIPILAYRLYALTRANYSLNRDRLKLSWGLREEKIPLAEIEWVRPRSTLSQPIPMPFFRLPGSVLGSRHQADLGPIEFLASDEKSLLLVATPRKIFAISPQDPVNFLQGIQHAIEQGSLSTDDVKIGLPVIRGGACLGQPGGALSLAGRLFCQYRPAGVGQPHGAFPGTHLPGIPALRRGPPPFCGDLSYSPARCQLLILPGWLGERPVVVPAG